MLEFIIWYISIGAVVATWQVYKMDLPWKEFKGYLIFNWICWVIDYPLGLIYSTVIPYWKYKKRRMKAKK
jgi:hypothetical protein